MDPSDPSRPARLTYSLKKHRMSGKDFQRAYAKGSRARGSLMTVAVVENDLEHARMGLSVGKRCWKSAVKRNRVRRVFREAFRLSRAQLPVGIDVVLISSTPRLEPRLAETQRELVGMVAKAYRRLMQRRAEEGA